MPVVRVFWWTVILVVSVRFVYSVVDAMKNKDKEKGKMASSKAENLTPSECVSRKEVGVHDSTCTTVPAGAASSSTSADATTTMLDKLVVAVDTVAGKLSYMENRLLKLETESVAPQRQEMSLAGVLTDPDEPFFVEQAQSVVKTKHCHVRQVVSDADALESDAKSRKKKHSDKKTGHAIKTLTQEAQVLSRAVDKIVVERRSLPTEGPLLGEVGILTQREMEEMSDIALETETNIAQVTTAQATQLWEVQPQATVPGQKQDDQRDLLDFITKDQPAVTQRADRMQNWMPMNQQCPLQPPIGEQSETKAKQEEQWKQDPRSQALIADRMQQIETDVRNKSIKGKGNVQAGLM